MRGNKFSKMHGSCRAIFSYLVNKCGLGVEKLEKKYRTHIGHLGKWPLKPLKLKIQPGKHKIRAQLPEIITRKVFINFKKNAHKPFFNKIPMGSLYTCTCQAKMFIFFLNFQDVAV